MIRKLSMFLISSSEDDDGSLCLLVLARVLPPPRVFRCFGVLIGSMFGLPPHEEGQAQHASASAQAPLPRRLPRLSTRLHCLVGWRASACSCATLARDEKPAGSPQVREDRGLRLS